MAFRVILLFCALALPMTNAVINSNSESKIERREAFQTYGPPPIQSQPQQQTIVLPTPVYGAPAIGKFPPPPPERPPPPSKEYGVPIQQYGPPKVHVEYGPPPLAQSHQQIQTNNHRHQQVINHNSQNSLSFFDQIKESLGFGSGSSSNAPHSSYGPPPSAPINHFTPPKVYTKYGAPPKPQFISKPPTIYGPPKPHNTYGPPRPQYQPALKQFYGPPSKPAVNFKPQQSYGLPPNPIRQPINSQYGPPSFPQHQSIPSYPQHQSIPSHSQHQSIPSYPQHQSIPSFPKVIKGAGCDGWKPIPGPSIGSQSIGHSSSASISAIQPENTYLPPESNHLPVAESTFNIQPESTYGAPQQNTHNFAESILTIQPDNGYLPPSANSYHVADSALSVQPLPTNLQLPAAEATSFHNDAHLGSSIASGLGLTSINVVKSEGIELSNNIVDSYSLPPADSFAPNFQKNPPTGLTPPNSYPYPLPFRSFKQHPIHVNAPRHPVSFRPPVPQGLLESIGQSVQHQDQFGVKLRPQSNVYLPPPTNEVPPPGLNSLPLAPAVPFHSGVPKANLFEHQFVYAPSPCSHGPNLGGGNFGSGSNIFGSIPQLQTVYGVPNQALDVSQSSSFEIAQNDATQGLLTSYGPPASGSLSSYDSLINTREPHAPLTSYGPPPSGNPADSYAHGSQKSVTTVQIDSVNSSVTSNLKQSHIDDLPGLSSSGLDIVSAQKSVSLEVPIQGQHGSYSLQFQAADPLASQNNEVDTPDHQKLLTEGLLQSILSAIDKPKSTDAPQSFESRGESLDNHPEIKEFVNSAVGHETLAEVKAE